MASVNSNGARGNGNSGLIPAVVYIRMSTDDQADSPEQQRREIAKYATANNYRIVREYLDEGISGWKEERDGFQQLITDLTRGDFEAVLCWDQNRFSRFPVLEANHYWYLLDRAGVHLATCNQGRLDWHSIAGWLTASITQYGDAQHRHKLSADVKRGKQALAERGIWQGRIPIGYKVNGTRKLELGDDHEVAIVRRIYSDYLAGKSTRHVGIDLNNEGIQSRHGRGWSATTINTILSNPAYIGTYQHGSTVIERNHPAVIDRDTFATVARKMEERKPRTSPFLGGGGYLFTGLIKCGKCGSAMCGYTAMSGNRHYHCHGRMAKGASFCDRNSVEQSELAEHVVSAIYDRFTAPAVVKRLRAELHNATKATTSKVSADKLRQQLGTLETKLSKAKRRLVEVDHDMLALVQDQIRDLTRQRGELEAALEAARTPRAALVEQADAKVDKALEVFARLRTSLHSDDTLELRELLAESVDKVDVWTTPRQHGRNWRCDFTAGGHRAT